MHILSVFKYFDSQEVAKTVLLRVPNAFTQLLPMITDVSFYIRG